MFRGVLKFSRSILVRGEGVVTHATGLWPRILKLLGHWPTGQKVQNDHWLYIFSESKCSIVWRWVKRMHGN